VKDSMPSPATMSAHNEGGIRRRWPRIACNAFLHLPRQSHNFHPVQAAGSSCPR
jgi:hypothetical protein